MTRPNPPSRTPLSAEEMDALVEPAKKLAEQLFTTRGTDAGIQAAFEAFRSTGLMKVLKDDVVGAQLQDWAERHGMDLDTAGDAVDAKAATPDETAVKKPREP